ncbi:MAG: hypothetical protein AAF560_11925 [Acidobacteriota bacterium]
MPRRPDSTNRLTLAAQLNHFLLTLSLGLIANPATAGVQLLPPIDEFPPTTQDLNSVAAGTQGDFIIVGNGATVIRRTLDAENNPIWTSLDAWAASFFNAEIFTVELSPVAYPAGDGWIIGGREALVETDFTDTLVVDSRPGTGSLFTPILATADAIWYGVPDLGVAPSFLHRYDRASQTAPGIAFPVGAVLAMCELPNGNIRYVTTDGDIEEITSALQRTTLYDQPDGESLELNAASFSEDCEAIVGGDATSQSRVYAGFVEAIPPPEVTEPSFTPWRYRSRDGGPTVTASCILTPQEQGNIVGLFAILLSCDDEIATGDTATMSAFADFLNSRIRSLEVSNEQRRCQRDAATSTFEPLRRGTILPVTADFELITVGVAGSVQRLQGTRSFFADGFESGDLSAWSSVTR